MMSDPDRRARLRPSLLAPLLMLLCPLLAAAADLPADIAKLLDNLPDARVRYGALVVDLATGQTLFAHNPDDPLVPASNQKLVALAATVDHEDASSGFETVLGLRGRDVVVIADGDPGLGDTTIAQDLGVAPLAFLDLWAYALIASGNARIAGDLVVDATAFETEVIHPDWEAADLVRWYGAPIAGLNLANNCVEVTVWPADRPNAPALWSVWPPTPAAIVENNCNSAPGTRTTPGLGRRAGTFELVLSGKVGERSSLQAVSVHDPVVFAATAIRTHLAAAGVEIAGGIRYERVRTPEGELPSDLVVLDRHRTPLAAVLQRVGADSQNMCAEALFKRLGRRLVRERGDYLTPGGWSNGREAVSAFLLSLDCDLNTITIADGSGLSRRNRANASEFVRILKHMYEHPRRELFMSSLAGNRTGGTLKRRLRDIEGEVYAKTGYMSGVRSLSGYVHSRNDRWYAFSVIFNGFRGTSRPYNDKLRELCRLLSNAT